MKIKTENIIDGISCIFIVLFMYAAASKLIDFQKFRVQLGQSPLLTSFSGFLAWFIPTLEIIISGMLCVARCRLMGLYASFGLMTLFTLYIFVITHYSEYVPCSCGGVIQNMSWGQHLIFNLFFVTIALLAILFLYRRSKAYD
jgi:hypothetical protein